MRKLERILLLLSVVFFVIGVSCSVVGFVFEEVGKPYVTEILYPIAAVAGSITIDILIARLIIMVNIVKKYRVNVPRPQAPKQPKTVDVKEIKKTREQELYEQYEGLYNQGLISKEDLDKKRTELLGK